MATTVDAGVTVVRNPASGDEVGRVPQVLRPQIVEVDKPLLELLFETFKRPSGQHYHTVVECVLQQHLHQIPTGHAGGSGDDGHISGHILLA